MDAPISQNQGSALLRLPLEMIHLITDLLTPVQRVLFSQTCRSLQNGLGRYPNASKLSRIDYFAYLAGHARGLPDQWVCEDCMALHPMTELDTPAAEYFSSSCPLGPLGKSLGGHPCLFKVKRMDTRLYYHQIRIEHQHIQLALKYTRLQQPEYNKYLQALLAPHHRGTWKPSFTSCLRTRYSAYPKVIADDDGNLRFMLLSTWRYRRDSYEDISFRNMGYQIICPHLETFYHPMEKLIRAPLHVLEATFEEAFEAGPDGKERTSACPHCATDFSVRLTPTYMDLHVWQDFGSEVSPVDPAWKSHHFQKGCTPTIENTRTSGPTIHHEPGSVRLLYGPETHGPEIRRERNKASL
ncbi:hypothetical protein F4820DRAFT_470651 [Hypoxylon rubiginosum]|uniref:Uncharacterized protein n=1 Tax=Hypoxylon rubiginosum TaxID=110542 RepID=A0ACB9YZ67_9PEZI|nr:hypothetical protein F4820DRAFT_470651 [Hypoxylon rubiginosum]